MTRNNKPPSSMADLAFDTLKTLGGPKADADREPDFAGPDGPAKFSKRPGADHNPAAYGLTGQDAPARPDAATGQPGSATMPSPPDPPRGQVEWAVMIDQLWYDRLKMLATKAGVDPSRYVEGLIKAKWVLGPMDHPVPR